MDLKDSAVFTYCLFNLGKHVGGGGGVGGGNRGEEPRRKEAGGVREGGVDGVGSEIPKVARSWRNSGKIIMQHCTTFCNKKKCKTKKAEPTKIGW